jgi:hypothetical protein
VGGQGAEVSHGDELLVMGGESGNWKPESGELKPEKLNGETLKGGNSRVASDEWRVAGPSSAKRLRFGEREGVRDEGTKRPGDKKTNRPRQQRPEISREI